MSAPSRRAPPPEPSRTLPALPLDRRLTHGSADLYAGHWPSAESRGPAFLCVHGLAGSHLNWSLLAPKLSTLGPVWAPDLLGFGRSGLGGRRADLAGHLALLREWLAQLRADRRVVVIGNSMGGYLALKLAAEAKTEVAALVLINPALPLPSSVPSHGDVLSSFLLMMLPWVGERYLSRRDATHTAAELTAELLVLCAADSSQLDASMIEAHILLARERGGLPEGRKAMLQSTRSLLLELFRDAPRFERTLAKVRAKTLLLHGSRDRLVPVAAARALARLRPQWPFKVYPGLGHIPMLEAPQAVFENIAAFCQTAGVL